MTTKQKLTQARQLIQTKNYTQARAILQNVNHPLASEWLNRIDQITGTDKKSVSQPQIDIDPKSLRPMTPFIIWVKLGFLGMPLVALFYVLNWRHLGRRHW